MAIKLIMDNKKFVMSLFVGVCALTLLMAASAVVTILDVDSTGAVSIGFIACCICEILIKIAEKALHID